MTGLAARRANTSRPGCATFHPTPAMLGPVLENTLESAGNLPDSEVFSRLKSFGFGRDGLVRKAGRMADSMFSTSRPSLALEKARGGFQSQSGVETMTNVIPLASRCAAIPVQSLAQVPPFEPATDTTHEPHSVARQQAIENALSTALYYVRLPYSATALKAATGRANRALSLLKNSCDEAKTGGAA